MMPKPPPLRIAFIDYVLEPDKPGRSGLSDIVWDMASCLIDLGHEAHIIACYKVDRYPDPRVVVHSFEEPPIGYRNLLGQLWILKRAAAIAKRLRPDILHAPEYLSIAVCVQLGVDVPMIVTVPGNIFQRIQHEHEYEWLFVQTLKWAARKAAAHAAAMIAISAEMKVWWEHTGSLPECTPFIPLGVNKQRFYPVPNARAQLQLDPDRPIFLFAGRFAREKGILDLLAALVLIRPHLKTYHAQIILLGRGKQAHAIHAQVEQFQLQPYVQIRDWVPQETLRVWYSAADAILLPSHSEGASRVIPEAMACGTPIIGTTITGTVDHVQHGATGLLCPPKTPAALAANLRVALEQRSQCAQMGNAGYRYFQTCLQWRQITQRIVNELYEPIVAANRNRFSRRMERGQRRRAAY